VRPVRQMVRHDQPLRKSLLKGHRPHAQPLGLLRAHVRRAHHDLQPERLQQVDHQPRDHPQAQDGHRLAIVPGTAVGAAPVRGGAHLPGVRKVALGGQQDLRERELGHRHGVRRPGAHHGDAALQEGAGERLHAAGRVKDNLQAREQIQFRGAERREAPSAKDSAHVRQVRGVLGQVGLRDHRRVQIGGLGDLRVPPLGEDALDLLRAVAQECGLDHGMPPAPACGGLADRGGAASIGRRRAPVKRAPRRSGRPIRRGLASARPRRPSGPVDRSS